MVSIKLLVILLGISIGSIAVMSTQVQAIPNSNIGIAPTDAMHTIQVQTSPWAVSDTLVVAEQYDQQIYFVSDGSIIFNVTEAVP